MIWIFLRVFVVFGCEVLCIPLLFLLLLLLLFLLLVILLNKPRDSPNLQLSLNRCDCTEKTRCNPRLIPQKTRHNIYTESGGAKLTRSNSTTNADCKSEKDPAKDQKHVWEGASLKPVRRRNRHLSICRTAEEDHGKLRCGTNWAVMNGSQSMTNCSFSSNSSYFCRT